MKRSIAIAFCAFATIVFAGYGAGKAKGDDAEPPTRAEAVDAISAYYMHEYADNLSYNRGEQRAWNVRVDNVDVIPAPVQATRFGDAWPVRADVTITGTIPSTGQVDVNDTVGRKTERIYVLSADAKADWRVTPAPDDGEYTPIP